jgi:hypothetical protein
VKEKFHVIPRAHLCFPSTLRGQNSTTSVEDEHEHTCLTEKPEILDSRGDLVL